MTIRKKKKLQPKVFPFILIIVGIALMSIWLVHRVFYNRALRLSDALIASYRKETTDTPSFPIHITIAGAVSLPIVEAGKIDGTWTISNTSANHVHESASPGGSGNIIIYGHNLNNLFGNIQYLKGGEIVNVRTTDGLLHVYKVVQTQIVDPSQTQLLAPTTTEVLTLYTCTGFFDSQRFVVRALPTQK